jgi:hypothetical protein
MSRNNNTREQFPTLKKDHPDIILVKRQQKKVQTYKNNTTTQSIMPILQAPKACQLCIEGMCHKDFQ